MGNWTHVYNSLIEDCADRIMLIQGLNLNGYDIIPTMLIRLSHTGAKC